MAPSLEGKGNKAKEAPSSHEARLGSNKGCRPRMDSDMKFYERDDNSRI